MFAEYDDAPGRRPPLACAIRPMAPGDVERVAAIWAARDPRALEGDRVTRVRGWLDPPGLVVVAEESAGARVVGYGRAAVLDPEPDAPGGWYLTGLVVDPGARRAGVGWRLTTERLRRLASMNAKECFFVANERNRASIELHERAGFRLVRTLTRFPGIQFEGGAGLLFHAVLPQPDR